jgi:hypothetical protein
LSCQLTCFSSLFSFCSYGMSKSTRELRWCSGAKTTRRLTSDPPERRSTHGQAHALVRRQCLSFPPPAVPLVFALLDFSINHDNTNLPNTRIWSNPTLSKKNKVNTSTRSGRTEATRTHHYLSYQSSSSSSSALVSAAVMPYSSVSHVAMAGYPFSRLFR